MDYQRYLTRSNSDSNIANDENQNYFESKHVSFCTCKEHTAKLEQKLTNISLDSKEEINTKMETYQYENYLQFKTYEIPTLRVVVQGPEILSYQGTKHSPNEIAKFWKKDSRMWLWKSPNSKIKKKIKPNKSFRNFY